MEARPCIKVQQPIGEFYVTSLPATAVINRVTIAPRRKSSPTNEDVQRELSSRRVGEIAQYATDPDATFPTPIILSVDSSTVEISGSNIDFRLLGHVEDLSDAHTSLGEVLDGQHRIRGLQRAQEEGADLSTFELIVVVMLDLSPAEKAYVFSTINSKQTPVSKSLIYDLFGLTQGRSPQLTAHEIARAMNIDNTGPFYRGLKMLGRREASTEMLTQGSFVKYLLALISTDPDRDLIAVKIGTEIKSEPGLPFNAFWREKQDEMILRSMTNYFSAVKDVFPEQWEPAAYARDRMDQQSFPILRRTVGYEALMRSLQKIWPRIAESKNVRTEFFKELVERFKNNLGSTPLNTAEFGSSSADAGRLSEIFTRDL